MQSNQCSFETAEFLSRTLSCWRWRPWKQAKPNELLRFKLTGAEEELLDVDQSEGAIMTMRGVVHGLRFDKRCSKLRPMADTWSKVSDISAPSFVRLLHRL